MTLTDKVIFFNFQINFWPKQHVGWFWYDLDLHMLLTEKIRFFNFAFIVITFFVNLWIYLMLGPCPLFMVLTEKVIFFKFWQGEIENILYGFPFVNKKKVWRRPCYVYKPHTVPAVWYRLINFGLTK